MYEDLKIILYPDPRLLKMSKPVEKFDQNLKDLAERMFVLMRENRGVGLAAPQVRLNIRMFVMNSTGKPEDDRVYVNPELTEPLGEEDHRLLAFVEERTAFVEGQGTDLLVGHADPLRRSGVGARSVLAAIDERGLEVGELLELRLDGAPAGGRPVERHELGEHVGPMRHHRE